MTSETTDHTCTTATALQLHCTTGCQGFVCVAFPVVGKVGRSVRSVEVTPLRSQYKGVEMTRLEARVTETVSQNRHSRQLTVLAVCTKSSRPGLSSVTGQVKASGAQSYWPVQCDGTSEVFWKSSRTGPYHPAIRDK